MILVKTHQLWWPCTDYTCYMRTPRAWTLILWFSTANSHVCIPLLHCVRVWFDVSIVPKLDRGSAAPFLNDEVSATQALRSVTAVVLALRERLLFLFAKPSSDHKIWHSQRKWQACIPAECRHYGTSPERFTKPSHTHKPHTFTPESVAAKRVG